MILCSEGFRQFFQGIQTDTDNMMELFEQIRHALLYVAEEAALGKVELALQAPVTVYEPDGVNQGVILYGNERGYEESCEEMVFHTPENGVATIRIWPASGHLWNEEEREAVSFLAQNLFMICGRCRVMGLMKRTLVTDALTGAANPSGMSRFGRGKVSEGTLSLYHAAFTNIRNFRYLNQKVGARQGDDILIRYAAEIKRFLQPDELLVRLGGDNFVIFVRKERMESLLELMRGMEVSCQFHGEILNFRLESRLGCYSIQSEDTLSNVLNRITSALSYARKITHSDVVWFEPFMLEDENRDKQVQFDFPRAVQEREFVVYYQPKVSLENNELCGSEALVRWMRDGKLVPPLEFIPALEKGGNICQLDFYVFETVCQDMKRWITAGIEPVKVSVNFSKLHLKDDHFAEKIVAILEQYQVDSSFLEVELTESASYEDYERLENFISHMKNSGVAVSIDDFGTGYSSLSLLKDLKVDIIKLDKSFLDSLEENNRSDEIVIKNIVHMVNELDMKLIAEGVETRLQADFLRNVHCSMAQGYLFDRPMPEPEFEERLRNGRVYL